MEMSVARVEGDSGVVFLVSPRTGELPPRITTRRWQLIENIFSVATDKTPTEQDRYLESVCGANELLKRDVKSPLRHNHVTKDILRAAVSTAIEELPQTRDQYIGSRIGPYHVVHQLNQGGMGVVYLAIRSDQHYLQTVAIKVVKSGLNSEELANRFRYERQILANLNHPNIPAILDGGNTPDGLPYIVMEYIEGQPITGFCKSRELSPSERVLLFRRVCLAVHDARGRRSKPPLIL